MIKKLVSHLGEYKRAAILTPMFSALEAVMDILLPTIMAFIIDLGIEKGDMNAILKYGLLTFAVAAIALLLGILAGVAVYGVLVIALRILRAEDLQNIRGGEKIIRLLHLK